LAIAIARFLEGVMTKREALALTREVLDDLFDGIRPR
jgi:hypothetical protein